VPAATESELEIELESEPAPAAARSIYSSAGQSHFDFLCTEEQPPVSPFGGASGGNSDDNDRDDPACIVATATGREASIYSSAGQNEFDFLADDDADGVDTSSVGSPEDPLPGTDTSY
jgi:hypothetical protein